MSRRTSRSAAPKSHANPPRAARPAADDSADPRRSRARPNAWFLAAAVLMQAVWCGFLMAMVLWG